MPYITQEDRCKYINTLKMEFPSDCKKGELTYILYALALKYIRAKGVSYTNISDAIGCLIDSAEEIRRRILNPYEDKKIKDNGDIDIL